MRPDFDRAARMAYKTLLALNVDALPVDPLMILTHCRNAVIHDYDDVRIKLGVNDYQTLKCCYFDNLDAMTFRREYGDRTVYEVFFDNRAHFQRRRFTLAHELGHIVLKHRMEERWEEQEADYYAAQLLAPHPIICRLPDRSPDVVARICRISKPAAQISVRPIRHRPDLELDDALVRQITI